MAVYPIDCVNGNAGIIASIKSALLAADIVTTIHYEVAPFLIFTSTRSNKVIKIDVTNGVYIGDAYTSGSTVTNQKNIVVPGNILISSGSVIVSPDYLVFALRSSSAINFNAIFGVTDVGGVNVAYGSQSSTTAVSSCLAWNCANTTPVELLPAYTIITPILAPDNFWYQSDMYFKDVATNVLLPNPMKSMKMLSKGREIEYNVLIYGDDALVNLGYIKATANLTDCCMLLVGGNV